MVRCVYLVVVAAAGTGRMPARNEGYAFSARHHTVVTVTVILAFTRLKSGRMPDTGDAPASAAKEALSRKQSSPKDAGARGANDDHTDECVDNPRRRLKRTKVSELDNKLPTGTNSVMMNTSEPLHGGHIAEAQ